MRNVRNRIVSFEAAVATDQLAEHPNNWRRHTSEQRDALSSVLEQVGVAGAVLAYRSDRNPGKLTIIDGHLRSEMMTDRVPVLVLDVNDAEADLLLATYDPIGQMAAKDEKKLEELMAGLTDDMKNMDQLWRVLGHEQGGQLEDDMREAVEALEPTYPIEPQFDEAYNFVVIFCKTQTQWNSLAQRLKLSRRVAKGRIRESRVLGADEFMEQWDKRAGAVPLHADDPVETTGKIEPKHEPKQEPKGKSKKEG